MFISFDPFLGLILAVDFDIVMPAIKVGERLFRVRLLRVEPPDLSIKFTHASQYALSIQRRKPHSGLLYSNRSTARKFLADRRTHIGKCGMLGIEGFQGNWRSLV